mgnify:CR=1 FL=1
MCNEGVHDETAEFAGGTGDVVVSCPTIENIAEALAVEKEAVANAKSNAAREAKKIVIQKKTALEFRCATVEGKTVQDVLPGSVHPSGTTYQWGGKGNWQSLPALRHLVSHSDLEIPRNLGQRFARP